MIDMKPIYGIQINFNADMLLFVDPPIDNDEDRMQLQANLDKMKHDIKALLESTYNRTEWDDTIVQTNNVTYITEDNIDDYLQGEIYIME